MAKPRAAGGTLLDKIGLVGAGIVVFVGLVLARIAENSIGVDKKEGGRRKLEGGREKYCPFGRGK